MKVYQLSKKIDKKNTLIGVSITQKHEDCHYETTFWERGLPLATGYGFSQKEADTKGLIGFLKENHYIGKSEFLALLKLKVD